MCNDSEIESEIEDGNTEDGYLIIDEQDKHKIPKIYILVINKQGKRSPIISNPTFATYFDSCYIAYDSNEFFYR